MNRKLLTLLTAAALVAALAACGKDNPQNTTAPADASSSPVTSEPAAVTEPTETTPPETTAPEAAPVVPLPEVKDGTVYTKEAIDYAFGGSFDFTHSLLIPKIDSEKPGAEALNAKMLADQQEKLDALAANKEENILYTVNYSTSGADGILVINVYEYCGWQYSESVINRRFYYYDAAADCELTADEVLARLSFTAETLEKAFRWSNEYDVISTENTDRTITPAATVFGAPLTGAYDASLFHYAEIRSGNEVELLGIDFDETTVSPCYSYVVYTADTVSCPISRENGQPLHPYAICTLTADDLTVGDAFRIVCKDGKVTEATVPADAAVQSIKLATSSITVQYSENATFDFYYAGLFVNGERTGVGAAYASFGADTIGAILYFSPCISPDAQATIEIVPPKS